MSWADNAIYELQRGQTVTIHPRGHSMEPRIPSGAAVTLVPAEAQDLEKGDVVLVRLRGNVYLHQVSAVDAKRVQISNHHGHVNGWASRSAVYGRATTIRSQSLA